MKCIKKLFTTRHSSCLHAFLFLLSCIFTSSALSLLSSDRVKTIKGVKCRKKICLPYSIWLGGSSLLLSILLCSCISLSVSAAVPGSESLRVYRGFMNSNDQWVHENIAVNNQDQMILYPLQNQSSAIFRFLFYPILTPQTSVKGVIIKDVDLSFYIEAPGGYTDVYVPDHNLCTAPHIVAGGITGWTGTVSNCSYWFATANDYNYVHYHFDVVVSGNTSYSITSSDLAPIYITVGTNQYNVANDVPIYQRAMLVSTHPVYFNNISYGSIQYATSATDALLQEMISHQDATTGAIEDLEQTTISNTDRTVSAINTLNTSIQNQTSQQHDDYEAEVEREEDKQDELEDQADDLTLSASSTGNPFASLFNSSGCVNMPTVGGWFNYPTLKVCSPYPSSISGILNFIGSAVIVGFLIKIYYKHMNGGYAS